MAYQMTFKRYELKYLLNKKEKEEILLAMKPHMKLDDYGRTVIRNIYFDTENFRLIRRSLEKPVYKEKLRIRSYKPVQITDPVFVEIKKKYKSVVYKRRLLLPEKTVMESFRTGEPLPVCSQIGDEIQYFREYYKNLQPYIAAYTCDKRNNGRSLQLEEQRSENREHQPGGTGIRLEQRRGSDHSQYNKRSVGAVYGDGDGRTFCSRPG